MTTDKSTSDMIFQPKPIKISKARTNQNTKLVFRSFFFRTFSAAWVQKTSRNIVLHQKKFVSYIRTNSLLDFYKYIYKFKEIT